MLTSSKLNLCDVKGLNTAWITLLHSEIALTTHLFRILRGEQQECFEQQVVLQVRTHRLFSPVIYKFAVHMPFLA